MALTISNEKTIPWGADRIYRCRATFTSVTGGTVVTGLSELSNIQLTNLTAPERASNLDYTTTLGSLIFTNLTAGDVVDIVAVGTR